MKRVVSALLLGTIVLSSLPWEAAALAPGPGSTTEAEVSPIHLSGAPNPAAGRMIESGEGPSPSELPVDECSCLCGMCAVSGHATATDLEAPRDLPTDPVVAHCPAATEADISSIPSGLFRPPKHG